MIRSAQLGAGYAIAPYKPALPDYYRVPGSNVVEAHAGNTVVRAPWLVTREAEAGSGWPEDLSNMMFTQNGQLVPATSATRDMFRGAGDVAVPTGRAMRVGGFHDVVRTLVPAAAMFAGGYAGYRMSDGHKGWGALSGAVVGGILGLIFR
ncbi:MAG: hypothetical protein JO277_06110 [Candidatus Eremiobacteraeota bacterium]|nr:hypothetical protein [Candidatus Eremiobacteraeota bacterium]